MGDTVLTQKLVSVYSRTDLCIDILFDWLKLSGAGTYFCVDAGFSCA